MPPITNRRISAVGRTPNIAAANIHATNIAVPPRAPALAACCCPACTSLQCQERTRFFAGQLLTEADLNNEQAYLLAKNRLHNRFLHGWGVVCGLQVVCSDCDGWVTVKTGYAIDPCGNDIIVCEETGFNVLQAIQACCTPPKQSNCAPLRNPPPATCLDVSQTWCITIEYKEQESRMVTSLQQGSKSCGCGGGNGSKGGCGCGCGGGASNGHSHSSSAKAACGCGSKTGAATTTNAGACEPTRIIEGFQLGVVCEAPPAVTNEKTPPPAPGTFLYQFEQCFQILQNLVAQKPNLTGKNPADAYQTVCNYLRSVQKALTNSFVTHCQLETAIDRIAIPVPPQQDNGSYVNGLTTIVNNIVAVIQVLQLDCFCSSILPPCPPDPCDNRLILACVTVQNGKIIKICHFGGRRQVVTFPSLYYWLSIFRFDVVLGNIITSLEGLCCEDREKRQQPVFTTNIANRESLASGAFTTTGFMNPSALTNALTAVLAQTFGAATVNSFSPTMKTVDLRPLVGGDSQTTVNTLTNQYKIPSANITETPVDADPGWTNEAVAASAQLAPAAFDPSAHLTVYTKGKQVVGFAATNPTIALQTQVQQLHEQLSKLNERVSAQSERTSTIPKTRKVKQP